MVKETENLGEEGGVAQDKGQGHETRRHITVYGNHGDTNYYFNILALACQSHLEAQDYTCRPLYAVFFCANLHINRDHMKKKKQQRKTKKKQQEMVRSVLPSRIVTILRLTYLHNSSRVKEFARWDVLGGVPFDLFTPSEHSENGRQV